MKRNENSVNWSLRRKRQTKLTIANVIAYWANSRVMDRIGDKLFHKLNIRNFTERKKKIKKKARKIEKARIK